MGQGKFPHSSPKVEAIISLAVLGLKGNAAHAPGPAKALRFQGKVLIYRKHRSRCPGLPDRRCVNQLQTTATRERRSTMIEQFIDTAVKSNDVVLFMKGTPQFPQCGFSGQVVQILDHLGVAFNSFNVLENNDLRNGIKTYSNWPTIPQLYVKGEFVGGCDIIREMFQAGELLVLLKEKGVAVRESARA
jgi:monothiol glutaredoxin